MDLAAVIERDRRRLVPLSEEHGDIRDLLNLLHEARNALYSVGNCHGCIQTPENAAELALYDRLAVLQTRG